LKTTRYFEEQILRKRPYIRREWCEQVPAAPVRRETQPDSRIRWWGKIALADERQGALSPCRNARRRRDRAQRVL